MILGQARARTPGLQPAGRPALHFLLVHPWEDQNYSRYEAATASAAMAAVSALRMRGPSVAALQPLASKSASSSGAHPPSGPMAISSVGISVPAAAMASSRARRRVVVRSCSARTMYVEPEAGRVAADAARTRVDRGSGS